MSLTRDFIIEMFHCIDGRDWESLHRFFSPEITYERPGYPPIVGIDELIHFYRDIRTIASGEHRLEHIIVVDGDAGASWGRLVGRSHEGAALDERFADCYTFEGNTIKTRISYFFRPAI